MPEEIPSEQTDNEYLKEQFGIYFTICEIIIHLHTRFSNYLNNFSNNCNSCSDCIEIEKIPVISAMMDKTVVIQNLDIS